MFPSISNSLVHATQYVAPAAVSGAVVRMLTGPGGLPTTVPHLLGLRLSNPLAANTMSAPPGAMQTRHILVRVEHAPENSIAPRFHGTNPKNASSILLNGFNIDGTGKNYSGYSKAGKGVYTSTSSGVAREWGERARPRNSGVAVIAIYPPNDPRYISVEVPEQSRRSEEKIQQFVRNHPEAHEVVLTTTSEGPHEVLLTRRALQDPEVTLAFKLADDSQG